MRASPRPAGAAATTATSRLGATTALLALSLACATVGGAGGAAGDAAGPEGAEIREVVSQVEAALEETQAAVREAGLPEIDAVTLTLQTGLVARGGAGAHFLVVSLGHHWSRETTQTIVLTLVPPRPKPRPRTERAAPPEVRERLAAAILGAARAVKEAAATGVRLRPGALSVQISFVVTEGGEGGARFTLAPVDVDFSGELERQAVHTIQVDFKAAV